jgi:ABC-type multidrug transport system fused ATPase/permease subunit
MKSPLDLDFQHTPPGQLQNVVDAYLQVLATLVIIAIVQYYNLIGIVPLCIVYYILQKVFRHTSREIQRIESVTRSPVYAHLSETLNGLSTIRAYQKQKEFIKENHEKIDLNTQYVLLCVCVCVCVCVLWRCLLLFSSSSSSFVFSVFLSCDSVVRVSRVRVRSRALFLELCSSNSLSFFLPSLSLSLSPYFPFLERGILCSQQISGWRCD